MGFPKCGRVVAAVFLLLAVAMLAIGIMTAIISVAVVLVPAAMTSAVPAGMLLLVALAHPLIADEVHRLAAGAVLATVTTPVLLMRRRHIKVHRPAFDDHREGAMITAPRRALAVQQIADVDAPIDAG